MKKNELLYFNHTQQYYRFVILKKIDENVSVKIPIDLEDDEFIEAISKVHINNLLDDGLLTLVQGLLKLTSEGKSILNKHYIDYQINLINISKNLGDFYSNKINRLKKEMVGISALYGASDTSKSIFDFIQKESIKLECVIDDDVNKQNNRYLGLPVVSVKDIDKFKIQTIIISSVEFQSKIKKKVIQEFGDKYKIINLFD